MGSFMGFMSLPELARIAITVLIVSVVSVWLLMLLITIPVWFIKNIMRGLYYVVSELIGVMHNITHRFRRLDLGWRSIMYHVDKIVGAFFNFLRNPRKRYWLNVLIFTVCVTALLSFTSLKEYYTKLEAFAENQIDFYLSTPVSVSTPMIQSPEATLEPSAPALLLEVCNVKTRLGVREQAVHEEGNVLVWLKNGDIVTDLGIRRDGLAENGITEFWAFVRTENNEEGWAREKFLKPIE